MKTAQHFFRLCLVVAAWLHTAALVHGADSFVAFGLTNSPIGDATITFENRTLMVTGPGGGGSGGSDDDAALAASGNESLSEGIWGVSVQLGEADSGIFVYPYHHGYVSDGNFMVGRVLGNVDGNGSAHVCSVRARREGEGYHSVAVDFTPIGAHTQVFEVFSGERLVRRHTNEGGAAIIQTYGQSGPRVNPFWRLRDGSIAAVVELSEEESMTLPNDVATARPAGNRLIIRAVDPTREVKFVTRVDVTGGGGLDHFLITEMRLGVFNHPHIALDSTLLNVGEGKLTVTNPDFGSNGSQHAVAIELEGLNRFDVALSPVELGTNGAAIVASAVGRVNRLDGDFLGYAGVRNSNGVLHAFASLPVLQPEIQIAVYRDGCLVGTALAPSSEMAIALSGTPKITGFGAMANGPQVRPGLAITLDRTTTFALPGGAMLEGDQVRFRAPGSFPIERLSTFVLCASELPVFTICSETTPQTINVQDFLAEWTPNISVKRFSEGEGGGFERTVTPTNRQGRALVQVNDTYSSSNVVSEFYSFEGGDLFFHGLNSAGVDQFSAAGLRWLPEQIRLGQTYASAGSFGGSLTGSGETYTVTMTNTVRAAGFDTINLPAGTFTALRLESVMSATFSTASPDPLLVTFRTNWLVHGIGLIKSYATLQDGTFVGFSELAAYNIITDQPRDQVANVGAGVAFSVSVNTPFGRPESDISYQWRRNGAPISGSGRTLLVNALTSSDAGAYSVVVSNDAGIVTSDAGSLHVVPFSEPGCFWVNRAGGTLTGHGHSVFGGALVVDGAGNVYVAGSFAGVAVFGTTTLTSAGGYDIFVAKLDASGQYLWARQAGGDSDDHVRAARLDAAGNLYLAGSFRSAAAFDAVTLGSEGAEDIFVAKADANGNFLWAARAGGSGGYESATGLAVDPAGNAHVTGSFVGAANFGEFTLTAGDYALFLAKLDANGNFLRARSIEHATPAALASGPAGAVYLTGSFNRTAAFGDDVLTPGRLDLSGFVSRLDANHEFVWTRKLGDGGDGHDVVADAAGNVFVTATLSGTATFGKVALNSGGSRYYPELFLARLDANGNFLWAGQAPANAFYNRARLAVDAAGDAYLFGSFYGLLETSSATFNSPSTDLVVSKVNTHGHTLWTRQFGGGNQRAIAVDATGGVYLAGNFSGSARFGDFILNSGGAYFNNLFVAKICGPTLPTITAPPQSLTVDAGSNATFSVTATGAAPLAYQWRKNGANIAGATSESLTITNAQAVDEGDYTVVVGSPRAAVVSGIATLTVNSPYAGALVFGAVNYQINEAGVFAIIDVRRTGTVTGAVTVDFGTGSGSALAGLDYVATAGTLRFGDGDPFATFAVPIVEDMLFETNETLVLRLCRPTGGAALGGPETATLTIAENDPPSPVILSQPLSRTVALGDSAAFRATATGQPELHFQWRKDGTDIIGANDSVYFISTVQTSDLGRYSVIVSNAAGSATSHDAVLTIYPPPVIHEQPQSQAVVRGHSVTLSVVASGANTLTQHFTREVTGPLEDRFLIHAAGREGRLVIHYDFFNEPDSLRIYRGGVRIFDTGLTSNSASATAIYGPEYYSTSETIEVVVNEGGTTETNTTWRYELIIVPETLRYEWRKDGVLLPGGEKATFTIYYARPADAGQYTVTVRDRYGSVISEPAMLTIVRPLPPMLHAIRRETGDIQFTWDDQTFFLEGAEGIEGPWEYVSNDAFGTFIEPNAPQRFFRLRENYSE